MPMTSSDVDLDLDHALSVKLILLTNLLGRSFFQLYGQKEQINVSEWRIVMTLAAHPGMSAADVTSYIGMHKMNTSRAVSRLVKQGYVQAEVDPNDVRRRSLSLTDEGVELHRRIAPTAAHVEQCLIETLTAKEQRSLMGMLDKLIETARAADARGWS